VRRREHVLVTDRQPLVCRFRPYPLMGLATCHSRSTSMWATLAISRVAALQRIEGLTPGQRRSTRSLAGSLHEVSHLPPRVTVYGRSAGFDETRHDAARCFD
jgi:hypothetical protein